MLIDTLTFGGIINFSRIVEIRKFAVRPTTSQSENWERS
jgi:hypothetical protein